VSNAIQGISYYFNFTKDTIKRLTHQLRKWFDNFRNILNIKQKQHNIRIYVWDNIFLPHKIEKSCFFGHEHKTITFECCYDLSSETKINDFFDTKLTDPIVRNDQELEEEFIKKYREGQSKPEDCFGPGCIVSGGKLRKRKNNKTYNKSKSHNRRRRRTHRRK